MFDYFDNEHVILLWSGGLDSTALIPYLINEHNMTITPLFINRGQTNYDQELKAIQFIIIFF